MIALSQVTTVDTESRKNLRIRAGDTVRISIRIKDKERSWIQVFEGLVIAVKHGSEAGSTFTVRRVKNGFGVEKILPLYSPSIDKIEIVQRAKTRRAKLYFLRDKTSKQVKQKLNKAFSVAISTFSFTEEKRRLQKEEEEKQKKIEEERAQAEKIEKEAREKQKEDESIIANGVENLKEEVQVEKETKEEVNVLVVEEKKSEDA